MLWLSFFWRSRTSAIDNSSGSCLMRMSSDNNFSNFNASSRLSSKLRISSIKSFDFFSYVYEFYFSLGCKENRGKNKINIQSSKRSVIKCLMREMTSQVAKNCTWNWFLWKLTNYWTENWELKSVKVFLPYSDVDGHSS